MKIFDFDDNATSYKYPIIKLLLSVLILAAIYNLNLVFHFNGEIANFTVNFLCRILICAGIIRIILSIAEILTIPGNRKKTAAVSDKEKKRSKTCSVDKIVSLADSNSIIEIQILSGNKKIKVGASSDYDKGKSEFFDKLFFIGEKEFETADDFRNALRMYSDGDKMTVISIDDLPPEDYKI